MKIDQTVKFKKTLQCSFSKDSSGRFVKNKREIYIVVTYDNILDKKVNFDSSLSAECIAKGVFRFLVFDRVRLVSDNSLYDRYFIGWYNLDGDMREFLEPTKMKEICRHMITHMSNYTSDKGILKIYFELV